LVAFILAAGATRAEDWPQLLGPDRNNATSEVLPVWKQPPPVLWRRTLGESSSNAVVAEGRVFLHSKIADREVEEVVALDAASGKLLWHKEYARRPYSSTTGNGPRTTPAVALGRVVAYGVSGMLTCYAADTGDQLWQIDTHKEFNVKPLRYGVTSSPLIEGNRVLVHLGGPGAAIAAFDLQTGKPIWKALDDPLTTTAPTVVTLPGSNRRQVVFPTALRIVAVDALDGSIQWEHPLADVPIDSLAAPIWTGELLISCSVHFGGKGIRLMEGKSGQLLATEVWRTEELGAYFQSGVPSREGDHFYMVTNTPSPGAVLRCADVQTGKVLWSKPGVADWHAGLMRTGDDKLLLSDGKGVLRLLADDPKEYRELARAEIAGLEASVNPVLANGRLYLRDKRQIICLQIEKP
jgi:outer membrane protein assembly factor BamB